MKNGKAPQTKGEGTSKLKIGHINVNGWTTNNHALRTEIIKNLDCHIVAIIETHLRGDKDIKVWNYEWKGKNRPNQPTIGRGGGGIGFLLNKYIQDNYEIDVQNVTSDYAYGLVFKNKWTGYKIGLNCVYIPPKGKYYNADSAEKLYKEMEVAVHTESWDAFGLVGDFNARTGNLQDVITNDQIPIRRNCDQGTPTKRGQRFIEFVIENQLCILNGRVKGVNNFTRKHSVLDYVLVRHEDYENITYFEVIDCEKLVKDRSLIRQGSRLPDHNAIVFWMKTN